MDESGAVEAGRRGKLTVFHEGSSCASVYSSPPLPTILVVYRSIETALISGFPRRPSLVARWTQLGHC